MRFHVITNAETGEVRQVPYTAEEEKAADLGEREAALRVPERVNNSQMRAALAIAGLLPGIEAFLNSLSEPDRTVARIGWDYGNEIYRVSPLVQAAQAAFSLTDDQVDELFRTAAGIEF